MSLSTGRRSASASPTAGPGIPAYRRTSVLLRFLLNQPGQLGEWKTFQEGVVSSVLARLECLRTFDRMRTLGALSEEEMAAGRAAALAAFGSVQLVELSDDVLSRAEEPFPTSLATLDALHLSTALLWQVSEGRTFDAFLTHDPVLGRAARAMGLKVLGCEEKRG